ncbi:unnamed protein product [Brachionus calyciflorus]|uniref:Uncharacterized protein n=1 Tax=Brachionus calyciflorus TaxID=104777 RepID=A0A813ZZ31_9BILA|nr:unnamed protein product [Brachionus calyciflorus]
MVDDVTNLLASSTTQSVNLNFSQNFLSVSPNISLKSFKNEYLNQMNKSPNTSFKFCPNPAENFMKEISITSGMALDFEQQIKKLEERAKDLRDDKTFFNNSVIPLKLNSNTSSLFNNEQNDFKNFNSNSFTPKFGSSNLLISTSLIQSSNNLSDQKSDDNFLKQIKEKLDSQLKETENLKRELRKTNHNDIIMRPEQDSNNSSFRNVVLSNNSNGLIDELVDLKFKLKEAQAKNEELKKSFKQNLNQFQSAFKNCVEDKDKLIDKKNSKINSLEEELHYLRKSLAEHENFLRENDSYESLVYRVQAFENFYNRINQILIAEEKRREKSYTLNESNIDHFEKPEIKFNNDLDNCIKALNRCLEDYQCESKHSKNAIKELQSSWENKEKQNKQKENELNENYNKKCETIRQEYDRLMNLKQMDIDKLNKEINELNTEINQLKQTNRKKCDAKDMEINNLKLNNDNLRIELANITKKLKQLKIRFDALKSKEKENQSQTSKTINHLETENEKLSTKCLEIGKELVDYQQKYESVKCQISKYEQLIDNLNEQSLILKRDQKENQFNLNQMNQNLEIELDLKNKLDQRCQELEEENSILKDHVLKHENCEHKSMEFHMKLNHLEQILNKKNNEYQKLVKKNEQNESKVKSLSHVVKKLSSEKSQIETVLKECQSEFDDCKLKLQNSTNLIQHSCKTNSLLKEEKDSLEKILQDNAIKLKNLNDEFEKVSEMKTKLEQEYTGLKNDAVLIEKKYNEVKKSNEVVRSEKESLQHELNQVKNELNNSQTSYKTLNKKLSQSISDKDVQILKLEQSVALYEKEINLLRQVEMLQKNQEENKVMEFANTVQQKLNQKNNKIESLKTKVSGLESTNENLSKENSQLSIELKNTVTKLENMEKEIKLLNTELTESKEKNSHFEKSLTKAAKKFADSEKKNEILRNELTKFKNKLTNFNLTEELNKVQKSIGYNQIPKIDSTNEDVLALNKIFGVLLKSALNSNLKISHPNKDELIPDNNLKNSLELSDDFDETTTYSIGMDEKDQEVNKEELYQNIENGLNLLNNLGKDLKKENNEVTQLLMQQTTLTESKIITKE